MSKPVIKLSDVSYNSGRRLILDKVSLEVNHGDFLAVTGPNGGGKTTLLRLMLKLIKPSEGNVQYLDAEGKATSTLDIGYLPQKNSIDSQFPITVSQLVAMGLMRHGNSTTETSASVARMVETIGLTGHSDATIGTLSGGQLQRALLGRALISRPSVLILDEPLSYIDKSFEQHIYEILECVRKTTTIVLVSHEMSVIAAMANRHLIVDGTVHECHGHHHFVPSDCE